MRQPKLLETQLEPHMLFNTLANLRALIGIDPPRAQVMLDHMNRYLRATLSGSRATAHPLSAEFARLEDYLALMAMRMGPRLGSTLELPDAAARRARAAAAAAAAGGKRHPPRAGAPGGRRPHHRASVGNSIHMVAVTEVLYFEAADKYVRVLTQAREYLIRTPLKDLLPRLDSTVFWQIHRGTVVNSAHMDTVSRDESGKLSVGLHGRPEKLPVSRLYAYLFKAM
jgi:DNA-binding LytR/AlgR family response regulator